MGVGEGNSGNNSFPTRAYDHENGGEHILFNIADVCLSLLLCLQCAVRIEGPIRVKLDGHTAPEG